MRFYQRGTRGTWWVDFTVAGKPRFKRSTGTTNRREAEEFGVRAQADQWRQAKLGERPAYTWGQAVASWLVKHADERRSIETMKDRLRWITGHLEHTPLTLITRDLVEDVMDLKIDEGIISKSRDPKKRPPPRPVAPKTLNNYVAEISKILHHAHALAWVDHVPALRKYEVGIAPINWLSQKQADRLLEELPLHLSVMAAFALATGLRESNVRLLCWDQVDLDNGMAWVEASSAKAKKPLGVPLNDDALMLLKAQQRLHPKWVFPYTPIAAGGEPGEPGPIAGCSSMAWYKAVKRAGLEGFRWHDLRHTWASWHVQAGTPLPILQELGGWSSFAMVQRYAHLGRNHTAAYANAVSRYNGGTSFGTKHADEAQALDSMGWLMGLEPTTTGITTRDSTN